MSYGRDRQRQHPLEQRTLRQHVVGERWVNPATLEPAVHGESLLFPFQSFSRRPSALCHSISVRADGDFTVKTTARCSLLIARRPDRRRKPGPFASRPLGRKQMRLDPVRETRLSQVTRSERQNRCDFNDRRRHQALPVHCQEHTDGQVRVRAAPIAPAASASRTRLQSLAIPATPRRSTRLPDPQPACGTRSIARARAMRHLSPVCAWAASTPTSVNTAAGRGSTELPSV